MFKNAYELQYFKEGFPICKPYRNPTNPLFKRKHHETRHFAKLRLNNPLPALDNGSLLPVYVRYRHCVEYRRKPEISNQSAQSSRNPAADIVCLARRGGIRQRKNRPANTAVTKLGHWAMYALMLAVPAAGIARQIGNGGEIHGTLAFSLLFLSLGHIGMVAYHYIKGESVLPRMLGKS